MNQESTKSVLDGIEVKEHGFGSCCASPKDNSPKDTLVIVGNCPRCAAPVYGWSTMKSTEPTPSVRYSCDCHSKPTAFESTVHTK